MMHLKHLFSMIAPEALLGIGCSAALRSRFPMCRKRFELTRRAAIIALCWCVTPTPNALADDTPACVAKVSAYVAELEQLLSTKIPWFRSHSIVPYDELQRKYFPFGDCAGDPVMIEASKSRFYAGIGYNPRVKYYVVEFSNRVVTTGFAYDVRQRKVESNGAGWVRDSWFNP
jgi:hypothetical protein